MFSGNLLQEVEGTPQVQSVPTCYYKEQSSSLLSFAKTIMCLLWGTNISEINVSNVKYIKYKHATRLTSVFISSYCAFWSNKGKTDVIFKSSEKFQSWIQVPQILSAVGKLFPWHKEHPMNSVVSVAFFNRNFNTCMLQAYLGHYKCTNNIPVMIC